LLFVRLFVTFSLAVFNRCFVHDFLASGLSCPERARLAEELGEARTRGRNLSRLRRLTASERAALERREWQAQARLSDHDAEHGCQP